MVFTPLSIRRGDGGEAVDWWWGAVDGRGGRLNRLLEKP